MMDVKGKEVLVLGLGVSGQAAAALLARKGARVKISDSSHNADISRRLEDLARYSVRYETGGHTASFCSDAEIVVVSPGADIAPLYRSGVLSRRSMVIGEMELAFAFCRATVVAVTGTNGKSTTVELIGSMLSSAGMHAVVCGNTGNPLSGEVDRFTAESVAVVEVSSFQLETIKNFKPHIAVLLNVAEDHYERHGNYERYRDAKFKIFKNQSSGDWAVLDACFRGTLSLKNIRGQQLFYGAEGEMIVCEEGIRPGDSDEKDFVVRTKEIPLVGRHNRYNVACAILVSRIMGLDDNCIREAIMAFKGLSHRFERIGTFRGVECIDDSKATNVDATRRALDSINKRVVLIAGGREKGGDYQPVLPCLKDKVKAAILIGEAQPKMKEVFSSVVPVFTAGDMDQAVRTAFSVATEGDVVMLSPMCSSFDMFSDYKKRGKAFQRSVEQHISGEKAEG